MEFPFHMLPAVAFVAGVVAFGVWCARRAGRRGRALAPIAEENGWSFVPDLRPADKKWLLRFEMFTGDEAARASNTLRGKFTAENNSGQPIEASFRAGDFETPVRHTDYGTIESSFCFRFSYLVVHAPQIGAGDLLIRPENARDRANAAAGLDDIDFESVEFSDKFWVKSRDKRLAYDVIHPLMMQLLLETEPPRIEIERGYLCIADGRRLWKPEDFPKWIAWTERFLALWPRSRLKLG